jgi:hypothetical protein
MKHSCYVSSGGRVGYFKQVEGACDDAEAAFIAADWNKDTWPHVNPAPDCRNADDNRWWVSDGFTLVKVQILDYDASTTTTTEPKP